MSKGPIRRAGFEVAQRSDLGGATEVVPSVDGGHLTTLIDTFETSRDFEPPGAYGGIIPSFFRFGRLDAHYLGRSAPQAGAKIPLLGCECGEWACWPLVATIRVTDETVTWSDFEQPHRKSRDYGEFGPFVFERAQYDDCLVDLTSDLGKTPA